MASIFPSMLPKLMGKMGYNTRVTSPAEVAWKMANWKRRRGSQSDITGGLEDQMPTVSLNSYMRVVRPGMSL